MARRRYRAAARAYGGRAKAYGRRGAKAGGKILGMSMPQLVGFAIGITKMDNQLPKNLILAAAVAPTGIVKGIAPISNFARGVILGNMVQGLGIVPGTTAADSRGW